MSEFMYIMVDIRSTEIMNSSATWFSNTSGRIYSLGWMKNRIKKIEPERLLEFYARSGKTVEIWTIDIVNGEITEKMSFTRFIRTHLPETMVSDST